MISGNRGEWSELYAFFYLAAEGRVFTADAALNKTDDSHYLPIVKIVREDFEYHCDDAVVITDTKGTIIKECSREEFREQAKTLYEAIVSKSNKKQAFSVPSAELFMQEVHASKIKAPSHHKSDILTQIRDVQTGFSPTVGWSIKSELGSAPTLLNAGKTTNFTYEITGLSAEDVNEINEINTRTKILDRYQAIKDKGGEIVFEKAANNTFERNLRLIDTRFPEVIAQSLVYYYAGEQSSCQEIVDILEEEDPLLLGKGMYEFKFKKFLAAVALGMLPSVVWDGRDEASGGYIIVTNEGNVVAFHIYNRDMFEDYLLASTRFEKASTSRHDYAYLYEVDGKVYLNLNLQIRFK